MSDGDHLPFEKGDVPREPQRMKYPPMRPCWIKSWRFWTFKRQEEKSITWSGGSILGLWPSQKLRGKVLKVYAAKEIPGYTGQPGEVLDKRFIVGCGDRAVEFLEIALEGKKRMVSAVFFGDITSKKARNWENNFRIFSSLFTYYPKLGRTMPYSSTV